MSSLPGAHHSSLMLLSSLGEKLGEGVMQETIVGLTPSPNLSPKGERNMRNQERSPVRANTAEACTMRSSPTLR